MTSLPAAGRYDRYSRFWRMNLPTLSGQVTPHKRGITHFTPHPHFVAKRFATKSTISPVAFENSFAVAIMAV